ncbi:hypothetical protein [Salinarchaeum laminariae]|uniref:hypothetical protein n=1 Tax=Salinarchaeum laminariae TaxID=869888 RepID=UPI0020BE878E|nr:hypothetical protein [Salinarchaeum laminariae]
MGAVKRLYARSDEWARGLSRGRYAALLAVAAATGVFVVGVALSGELPVVSALTMGFVLGGLEYGFGWWQDSDA